MASDLLLNWLNNEIELSHPVKDFEKDFANGYLFGELLYKFNQQSNFKSFSKKSDVASNLENFNKLFPTLRNLKVKFDSDMVDNIIKQQRGSALRLLYQLKMVLEKVYPPTDIAVLRKTGKMGDNQPALKIAHSKDKYDEHAQKFFQNRLQELNKPQKVLNMEKHLDKFDQEKQRQEDQAKRFHSEEMDAKDKMRQETRRAQINKIQRNAGFMEEWQQKGVEDWKKNQSIKKDREKRQLEFEYKQAEKYNNLTVKKIDEANKEVNDGIGQFEQTLKNIGINPKVRKDDADRAVHEHLTQSPLKSSAKGSRFASMTKQTQLPPLNNTIGGASKTNLMTLGGGMTLSSTGLKTKDKKTVTEKNRKDRERRRRKMIVDQGKTHIEMEQKRKEAQIIERMKRQAKQEEELQYESWRTNQCKNVIIEDRKLREARYEKRRELDQQTAIWREEEMMKSLRDQMQREMEIFQERDQEMRIVHKQSKREKRNEFGYQLFDAIFDIANEAYIHQQKQDSEDIDSRCWHEWLQLFVADLPISKDDTMIERDFMQDSMKEVISANLDQVELEDYLKNQGQWPEALIAENQPNLEQFLTGQTESAPAAGAKGGKAPAPSKAAAADQIVLEEGDTELPLQAPNNYLLGDALELIINMNFDQRENHKKPKMPSYLNLKLCFVGYAFAGKKTQANKLKEVFGNLDIYYLNDLVSQAVSFFEQNPESIQRALQQNSEEEAIQDDLEISEDSEIDEELNAEEDFRQCGQDISELLKEGIEITDDIYVRLFIAKLRLTYPHKSKKQLRRELKSKVEKEREITQKIQTVENEIQELNGGGNGENPGGSRRRRKKDPVQLQDELDKLNKELQTAQAQDSKGWILVDFPATFAQAKLLEQALSGYVPPQEQDKIDREAQIEEAFLLVQPNAKEVPPKKLLKSGLDAVIWIDCSRDECMRRALGRRFDNVNEKVYHIEDQTPLTTNAPLCERLQPMDEEDNSEATLIDRWISYDQNAQGLENWLKQFGLNSKKGEARDFQILNKVSGDLDQDSLHKEIIQVIQKIQHKKSKQEVKIKKRILEKIIQTEIEEAEKQRIALEEEEERKRKEAEGGDQQPGEEIKKEEGKVDKPEPATDRIGLKQAAPDNIDNDFKPVIMDAWQQLCQNYKQQMKKVFRQVRDQRERLTENFSTIQNQFLKFLHRPDQKQEKLDQFIKEFNEFSDQYPDLREDEQTKDELHQRVDILSDELWEIIEERKEQHIEERKKIMESGWVEYELTFAVSSAQLLMQSEVDKFKASVQLLHDYYHAFEDKLIPEAPQFFTQDLVADGEELPPVESLPEGADSSNIDQYQYPRLDKLFEKALKTQVVQDVTQLSSQNQDKKGAPPKGKDPKKPAEEEKPVEDSQYVRDMRAAIKVEKSILRYRLTQIRNWTLKRLREMRQKAIKVYLKLEDWIQVSNKTENDAIDEMSIVIKRAIEDEKKIQDELRVKFMDFCVDEKIMNYIEPPPEKLPALEEVRHDRFSISQLSTLVNELEHLAKQHGNGSNNVPNKVIVDLFVRKLENSKNLGDEGSLPVEWTNYTEYDIQNMARNLDKQCTGSIDWRQIATYIILLKSSIPTDKHLETYRAEFKGKDDLHNKQNFLQAQAWFDETEYSQDRDYSIPFPRVHLIKDLLFRVNKTVKESGEECISLKKYFKILKSKELTMFKRNIKIYSDILITQLSDQ
ncbi:sperm flagellar protein 2 [Stylonychia lemnae]|uniref:Sperm flagellar protein 2 n=1 Tax=Stylonychia lemnae TaxID=5949 RepID=A0A078A6K8_STYLE|nr:sperm flagellar protein 2 [Stylonychia lemnae]|eukprot:CDW76374.1 sperm flagellar protein 2 [Stylonychia lemnae]